MISLSGVLCIQMEESAWYYILSLDCTNMDLENIDGFVSGVSLNYKSSWKNYYLKINWHYNSAIPWCFKVAIHCGWVYFCFLIDWFLVLIQRVQAVTSIWAWMCGSLEYGKPTSDHIPKEKWSFLLQQPSSANSSSARVCRQCHPSHIY